MNQTALLLLPAILVLALVVVIGEPVRLLVLLTMLEIITKIGLDHFIQQSQKTLGASVMSWTGHSLKGVQVILAVKKYVLPALMDLLTAGMVPPKADQMISVNVSDVLKDKFFKFLPCFQKIKNHLLALP